MRKTEYTLLVVLFLFILVINVLIINAAYTNVFDLLKHISPPSPPLVTITNIFSVILGSLVLFTCIVIIMEKRDPGTTLAWLLILIFLPLLGFFVYLLLGRQFHKRRLTVKKQKISHYLCPFNAPADEGSLQQLAETAEAKERLIQLICNSTEYPITLNNEVTVLTDGRQIFPAIIEALQSATKYIYLETYILRNDEIGSKISQLLIDKAQKGVTVRVIFDGIGSRSLGKNYLRKMRAAGIRIEPFLPVRVPFFHNRINYRNHRKILIIDGTVSFVGGINIGDEYLGRDPNIGYWRDTHLRIAGDTIHYLQNIFIQDWFFVTKEQLPTGSPPSVTSGSQPPGNKPVQIAASGPDTHWESIMQVYYYAIATAQKSIYLTSPYFVPNESILTALKTAALSGVDIKVLLPANPDYRIVFYAAMSYLEELMEAGIEIYFYQNGFMHAKILIIDGLVSSVGSANMDRRSFSLNFEVNALIYDKEIARRLEADFINDLKFSERLTMETLTEQPLHHRVLESGARLLSPLL